MDFGIVRRGACALIMMVTAVSCSNGGSPTQPGGGNGGPPAATVTSVTIGGNTSVARGSTAQLTATANRSDGTTEDVTSRATWQSTNPAVASVSSTGLVTGLTTGTADVTAAFSGQTARRTLQIAPARYDVSVTIHRLTALSTCDDLTQGPDRGEFAARVVGVTPDGSSHTFAETTGYPGNPSSPTVYSLAATGIQVFNRTQLFTLNGESGQSVRIQLDATEWDGEITILPPSIRWIHDSRMSNASVSRIHSYSNGTFTSLGDNTLTIGNASCGIWLNYTVSATRQ